MTTRASVRVQGQKKEGRKRGQVLHIAIDCCGRRRLSSGMARKLRLEFPGACYHVINRGNYRADIFRTEGAKATFEAGPEKGVRLYILPLTVAAGAG